MSRLIWHFHDEILARFSVSTYLVITLFASLSHFLTYSSKGSTMATWAFRRAEWAAEGPWPPIYASCKISASKTRAGILTLWVNQTLDNSHPPDNKELTNISYSSICDYCSRASSWHRRHRTMLTSGTMQTSVFLSFRAFLIIYRFKFTLALRQ